MITTRIVLVFLVALSMTAQTRTGTLRGKITLKDNGDALHHADILVTPLGRAVETNEDGNYEISNLPPGTYTIIAKMQALSDAKKTVVITAGSTVTADFALSFQAVREKVTVTATGREVELGDSFQSVTSRDAWELQTRTAAPALGEALENETGIAKRSSGPGASRPVIRGFDGDRVLILQDGVRTGTLSSQSGDHAEPVDVSQVERIEVVRGPATLLYGSNAIGGVVNVVSGHHVLHEHPHEGLHGTLSTVLGSANNMGLGSGSFEYGKKDWLIQGGGGYTRSADYNTPIGKVINSWAKARNAQMRIGRYGEKFSWNFGYGFQDGIYAIPLVPDEDHEEEDHQHAGPVQLDWRRHNTRLNGLVKNLGSFVDNFSFNANYSDWNHREIAGGVLGTSFFNKQATYTGTFQQRRIGHYSGSFGFWGLHRDFKAIGAEALAPPVRQDAVAGFGLQEFSWERVRLQFGGRVESNRYSPDGLAERQFTGASGSAGMIVPLWKGGSVVANYMHSFRAPALEELYNLGPHPGNAIYEIGNPNLVRELGEALEIGVRQTTGRVRVEANFFHNHMRDFVYFRPTGRYNDGLVEAEYAQANTRFLGAEGKVEVQVHPALWVLLGFDAVDANLTKDRSNLPRIPPVRGRAGVNWFWRGFSFRPELVLANRQWQVAPYETETAGYALFNLVGGYTFARAHDMHMFSVNLFNAADRLYRNHLSFTKAYAPEIGRGVRFGYTLQWF